MRTSGVFGCAGSFFIIALGVSALIGIFTWPYTINTWLLFAHKDPAIVWWQGLLLGFVPGLGQLSLPLAVLTWIAMLFLK